MPGRTQDGLRLSGPHSLYLRLFTPVALVVGSGLGHPAEPEVLIATGGHERL